MDYTLVEKEMEIVCKSQNWRKLVRLIDDGYKGMFVILKILQESDKGVVAGEIAKKMNVSTARVASALNSLEKKGYIERKSEKSDGRKVVIFLTEQGKTALTERKKHISNVVSCMFDNISKEETKEFFSLLNKLLK